MGKTGYIVLIIVILAWFIIWAVTFRSLFIKALTDRFKRKEDAKDTGNIKK